MDKLTPETVRAALDAATPGPWEWVRGHSDWGLPRSNAIIPMGVSEYDFDKLIAEVHSQTPYCLGASRKDITQSAVADANAHLLAMSYDLATAYLAMSERVTELEAALDSHHAEVGSNIWRFWRDKAMETVKRNGSMAEENKCLRAELTACRGAFTLSEKEGQGHE